MVLYLGECYRVDGRAKVRTRHNGCVFNEVLGKSFKADNDVHAVSGVQDSAANVSHCVFGGTNEANNEDSPTKCISDD